MFAIFKRIKEAYYERHYDISDSEMQDVLNTVIKRAMYSPCRYNRAELKFMCYSLDASADRRIISRHDANACKYQIMKFIKSFNTERRTHASLVSILRQEITTNLGYEFMDHRIDTGDLYPGCMDIFLDWEYRYKTLSNIVANYK